MAQCFEVTAAVPECRTPRQSGTAVPRHAAIEQVRFRLSGTVWKNDVEDGKSSAFLVKSNTALCPA